MLVSAAELGCEGFRSDNTNELFVSTAPWREVNENDLCYKILMLCLLIW